jgi:hypothetical protein
MSPPTEQLIRDYLNRLSVAGRGQLGPDDRRALTARTRDFIERKTGLAGPPTAVEVARLLSGLGDPAGLVSQEVRRLAALRGEQSAATTGGFLARVLQRDRSVGSSWHWPAQPGSRTDLQMRLLDPAESPAAGQSGAAPQPGLAGAGGPDAGPSNAGSQAGPEPEPGPGAVPAAPGRPADQGPGPAATGGQAVQLAAPANRPVPVPAQPGPQDRPPPRLTIVPPPPEPEAAASGTQELPPQPGDNEAAISPPAVRWAAAVAGWAGARPLEAAAVVVLGIGGAAYPPVWLLGVLLALASRVWDYRDKWLGLGVPVLLTIIGTAIGLAVAGSQGTFGHHVHDGWMFAVASARVSAVLGAAYLARRSVRHRVPPEIPPWNKAHRVA